MVIAVLFAGAVFGQSPTDKNSVPRRNFGRAAPETVTINGTLQLEKRFIAVSSDDNVYYMPMLSRYIGFIEGLKEGAVVSVEGYIYNNFIFPSKVNINGKSYNFAMNRPDLRNDRSRPFPDWRNSAPGWGGPCCVGPGWESIPGRSEPRWGVQSPNWGFYGPGRNRR
jgi:hypothetical protein